MRRHSSIYTLGQRPAEGNHRCAYAVARHDVAPVRGGMLIQALLICASGCSAPTSTFEIVDHRGSGEPSRYRETFHEAFYDIDPHGDVEIVLRRSEPSQAEPEREITQVIHIRSIWRSIPGETVAHGTQINATVGYLILSGSVGAAYEGAGSVFFKEHGRKGTLTGTLDRATLRLTRRLAGGHRIFERAELMGEFRAKRDRRRLVRLVNEMNRLFGPLPPNQSPMPASP